MQHDEQFEAIRDFALRLGVPVERAVRWTRDGIVPHVRIGRTILVPKDILTRLLVASSSDWESRNRKAPAAIEGSASEIAPTDHDAPTIRGVKQ